MNKNPQWGKLPALVLTKIFDYLKFDDVLRASATCSLWRCVLFQKRFFKDFKFTLNVGNDRQCRFFLQSLINLTSQLILSFDARNVYHVVKIRKILFKISRSDHIIGLRLQTFVTGLKTPSSQYSNADFPDVEQFFVEPIKLLLARKSPSLKVLDLGAIEPLALYSMDFLKTLARPQDLRELGFSSIKFDPSHYPVLIIEPTLFEKYTSLQVLSLDYDTLNDELLQTLELLPLKKFIICVHGLDETHPGISEAAWSAFSKRFKGIDLILTLAYAYEAVGVLHSHIFRLSMPITHIRVLFCNMINFEALDFISTFYQSTIKSIWWIDSPSERNMMQLYLCSGQDPFVMMSWLCHNLEEIVIHGYVYDPYNLVGIARLRGRTLKKFEVALNLYSDRPESDIQKNWEADDLHMTDCNFQLMPPSNDALDEYVLKLLRSDLVNQ